MKLKLFRVVVAKAQSFSTTVLLFLTNEDFIPTHRRSDRLETSGTVVLFSDMYYCGEKVSIWDKNRIASRLAILMIR